MSLKDEELLVSIAAIATAFIWINVQPQVGSFYAFGVVLFLVPVLAKRKDYFVQFMDKHVKLPNVIIVAGAVLVAWVLASSFVLSYSTQSEVAFVDFFAKLQTHTNIPVLGNDQIANTATYGILIPVVETMIFLSFTLMVMLRIFNIKLQWYKRGSPNFYKMIWVCVMIGVIGSMFHWSTRLLDDVALAVDFVFFFASALLVFRFKRLIEAMAFHIFVNLGVMLALLGGAV